MNGRLEHKLHNEKVIAKLLEDLPLCVTDYYYSRSASKESRGSAEYISKIRTFLKFLNDDTKNIDVRTITENEISKYLHSIEQTIDKNGNPKETSFSYRQQVWSILNSFFGYLRKKRIIGENPMDFIDRPSGKDVVKRVNLDSFDIRFLLESVDDGAGTKHSKHRQENWKTRDKAILVLFAMTGMRETALTEINLEDLDFYNETITVIDKRHKTHVYKMNDTIKKTLEAWLEDRENKLNGEKVSALFISNRKQRIHRDSVYRLVKKYSLEGLGYEISPHKLRAAFCTILYNKTKDIEFVRRAVGHNKIETTQRYVVDDNTARETAAEIMGKIY